MRLTLFLCALLSAVILGCQPTTPPPSPDPAHDPVRYALPTHEVTNGVYVVFASVPAPSLAVRLANAGAMVNTNGTVFIFDAVDSDVRRQAVTAALLSGAMLKGH